MKNYRTPADLKLSQQTMEACRITGWETSINLRLLNTQKLKMGYWILISVNTKTKCCQYRWKSFTTEYASATILTQNGNPANLFYGYRSQGVFSTSSEAASAGLSKKNFDGTYSSFTAGDIHFQDVNGE
jgi:hypothetical protein